MTLLTRAPAGLSVRLAALDQVLAHGAGRIDPAVLSHAEQVAAKAGERIRFGGGHTVVALAGTTGSGKSSLFNALAGEQLSQVGMRRPTTGTPHAAVWGTQDTSSLLDWLQVPRRHVVAERNEPGLEGLVLLDLPDVDSVEQQHRLEADRLVQRVDLLVWVIDPQKYADASLHERYLAPLTGHASVMMVILNQVDRLSAAAREGCVGDLGRLLRSEGLASVPVMGTSARTGEGIDPLRAQLRQRVTAKQAAVRRLEADLSTLADDLAASCGGTAVTGVRPAERDSLVAALSDAAGADVITEAVAGSHRLRARQATGWPVTRWMSRVRLDPARRLRLRDTPSDLVRTSVPGPSGVQRARVDSALRDLADHASVGLSDPWPTLVRQASTRSRSELPELLDRAVAGTDLGLGSRPRWWRAVGAAQLLLVGVAVIGLAWLLALFAVAWLQLPAPPLPHIGPLPLPTLMLLLGLLLGLILARFSAAAARIGASRTARRARRRIDERMEQIAVDAVVTPVERELAAHHELCAAIRSVHG